MECCGWLLLQHRGLTPPDLRQFAWPFVDSGYGGFAPTPPLGPAAATQPEGTRISSVGASPPRPRSDRQPRHSPRTSASPLWGLRAHAPARTGSRDTARGHARLLCGGFAPTPPFGPAAATQPEGERVSSVGASPPRPRSDRQPRHSPRANAFPLWGLRPHAPARTGSRDTARGQARLPVRASPPRPRSDRQPRHSPRAFRPPRPLRERAGLRGSDARRTTSPRGHAGLPRGKEPSRAARGYGSMWTSRRAKRQPSGVLRHSSW